MKLLLCVVLLFSGCSGVNVRSHKKPDNITHREDLQEKFEEIDANSDGVIDKSEARKHEESKPVKPEILSPTWAFISIMGFMAFVLALPMTLSYASSKIRDLRKKKTVQ
tara:strand:- start:2298 stop:2624 length:327 start_codon:yes stop_codon:yes gene_type:complete